MRPFFSVWFLILLGITGCASPESFDAPRAIKGVLDLRNWNPTLLPLVALDGEWKFTDGLSETFSKPNPASNSYIQVPGSWNHFRNGETEHGGEGTGTYRLSILLDKPVSDLSLQVGDVGSAFRLKINGKPLYENGKVAASKQDMVPSYKHPIILIQEETKELNLEIEVSNFHHISGGLRKSIYLGPVLQVFEAKKKEIALGWLLFGSTFLMGLYHLILFIMRRVERSALWFALFCIDVSIRGFFTGSVFVYEILPDYYWAYIHKLDLLSFAISLPLFSLFLRSVFPKEFHPYFNRSFLILGFVFSVFIIIFPSVIYMNLIRIFQALVGVSIIYFFYVMILALARKREGALLFSLGAIFLFATTANDILNQALWIKTSYIASWGLLAFLFSQTIMLSLRFSNAFVRLEELQKSLENKVLARTQELAVAKSAAEDANSLKDTFISLVTHDLRSPIATVIGVLQLIRNDYKKMDDTSVLEWLDRAEQTSSQSLEMIATLLDLNRLRSGSFPLDNSLIYIYPEVERVLSKLWSQAKSKNIRIENKIQNDARITVDRALLAEIFINLLSNAIKFSREGDCIEIEYESKKNSAEFVVRDTGVGIPAEMIPNLFLPEVKSTRLGTKNEAGTGLGLPLVYSIIKAYQGNISVESVVQKGTLFRFSIPQT